VAIGRGVRHVFAKAGRYLVRVIAADRAGNRAVVKRTLKIAKAKRHKHGTRR
jgi:hypothetical protein